MPRSAAVLLAVLTATLGFTMPVRAQDWEPFLKQATGTLQEYLRIDTTNPPGDVTQAAAFFIEILRREGINHEVFISDQAIGKLNLLAKLKGSGQARPILLLNHMDVVPVERDQWDVEPFGGELRDGFIWGRGALDMKGMGLAGLMALIRLKQEGVQLSRDVLWLAVCDEETGGGLGAKWLTRNYYDQLNPEFVLDEGGGISQGLLTGDGRIVIAPSVNEKQVVWLTVTARGRGGHGSMPHSENAVEILQQALGRLMAARAELEQAAGDTVVEEMRQALGELADTPYANAISKNTITLTSFQAGVGDPPKVNVIPSEATATLDCRLLPGVPVPAFLERLKAALGDERVAVQVTYQPAEPATGSPSDTAFFYALTQTAREFYPDAVVVPQLLPGATDARFFRAKGAIAYGFQPVLLGAEDWAMIHGHNERIAVEQFHRMIRIFYEILKRVAQAPTQAGSPQRGIGAPHSAGISLPGS